MITMKEVARKAGVSLGTVSNVLNKRPSVSAKNRNSVLAAVKKLKYRPNTSARALKTGTTGSIGLVIPDITNPFYPELARGVEDAARKAGYAVFLCNNDRSIEKEREYINALTEKNVDGIILVKPSVGRREISDASARCGFVLIDADVRAYRQFDIVNADDYGGALKAMELLHEYGHRRIAFISGLMESDSSRRRQEAYIDFLKGKGIGVEQGLIKRGDYGWYSGYSCAAELLRQVEVPTAIFAANDLMAIGAMKAARERRLDIPRDISVIGFDDIATASLCAPQLTTVRQPKYEIGTVSVETLLEKLGRHGGGARRAPAALETEIMFRESVGHAK